MYVAYLTPNNKPVFTYEFEDTVQLTQTISDTLKIGDIVIFDHHKKNMVCIAYPSIGEDTVYRYLPLYCIRPSRELQKEVPRLIEEYKTKQAENLLTQKTGLLKW